MIANASTLHCQHSLLGLYIGFVFQRFLNSTYNHHLILLLAQSHSDAFRPSTFLILYETVVPLLLSAILLPLFQNLLTSITLLYLVFSINTPLKFKVVQSKLSNLWFTFKLHTFRASSCPLHRIWSQSATNKYYAAIIYAPSVLLLLTLIFKMQVNFGLLLTKFFTVSVLILFVLYM
jgi:hypothetical protein